MIQIAAASASISTPPLNQADAIVPGSSKRKRLDVPNSQLQVLPNSTSASDDVNHNVSAKWKRKAARFEAENVSLRAQNESLKIDIERLKKHEDSLLAALLAASQKS